MAKRVDANQSEIVAALRAIGCTVQDLHEVGRGVPDIMVSYKGKLFLFEIKMAGKYQNSLEKQWAYKWQSPVYVVRSAEEAVKIVTEA